MPEIALFIFALQTTQVQVLEIRINKQILNKIPCVTEKFLLP